MGSNQESIYFDVNGLRLHSVVAGPPDGRLVILLHGFPEFWYGWRKQIPALTEAGFRVAAPDLRGYNLSDKPRNLSAYRLETMARDVIGLMDRLDCRQARLVGHDWGGALAWTTAVLHPERVERLAVLNAPYPGAALRSLLRHPRQLIRSLYIFFFQPPIAPEAILRNHNWEMLVESLRRTSRPGTFSAEDFEAYRQAWWRKDAMTGMLNWYRAFLRRPMRAPLNPRILLPVLLLWGAQDFALGRELARASIDACENGRLVFFENAGHWLQHEEPEAVNRELIQFMGFPPAPL